MTQKEQIVIILEEADRPLTAKEIAGRGGWFPYQIRQYLYFLHRGGLINHETRIERIFIEPWAKYVRKKVTYWSAKER